MQEYKYYAPERTSRVAHKKASGWGLLGILLIGGFVLGLLQHQVFGRAISLIKLEQTNQAAAEQVTQRVSKVKQLQESVTGIISSYSQAQVGVSVIDLESGQQSTMGDTTIFFGASTTKILTGAALLNLVEDGKTKLTSYVGEAPLQQHLQLMIQQSNNDSWELLNHQYGLNNLENYAHSLGLNSFQVEDNSITAADEAKLLQQLYQGKLVNGEHTKLLLSYMQDTNEETLIPPAVSSQAKIYHKYGALGSDLHDAAIIENGDAKYVLVIYTHGQDIADRDQRVELIHRITKTVDSNLAN